MLFEVYETYAKCRKLKLNIDAKDLDEDTIDLLYSVQVAIEKAHEDKAKATKGK